MNIEKLIRPINVVYKDALVKGARVVIYKPDKELVVKNTNPDVKYIRISTVVEAAGKFYTLVGYINDDQYKKFINESYINLNKAISTSAILSIKPTKII